MSVIFEFGKPDVWSSASSLPSVSNQRHGVIGGIAQSFRRGAVETGAGAGTHRRRNDRPAEREDEPDGPLRPRRPAATLGAMLAALGLFPLAAMLVLLFAA